MGSAAALMSTPEGHWSILAGAVVESPSRLGTSSIGRVYAVNGGGNVGGLARYVGRCPRRQTRCGILATTACRDARHRKHNDRSRASAIYVVHFRRHILFLPGASRCVRALRARSGPCARARETGSALAVMLIAFYPPWVQRPYRQTKTGIVLLVTTRRASPPMSHRPPPV